MKQIVKKQKQNFRLHPKLINLKKTNKMLNLLKKWYTLYIAVSFIIIIQSVVFEFVNIYGINTSLLTFYNIIFSTLLLICFWFFVNQNVVNKIKFEKEIKELKKFKRNFNFFQFHYKSIDEYDGFDELKGITFGKKNSSTQLTLILNPSCNTSRETFEEAYEVFQNYSEKIYLNILFNVNPSNTENPNKSVAENLLALNEQDPKKAKEAIIDWYINQTDLKTWRRKWNIEIPHLLTNKQLQNQYFWCLKNEFNNTPIKIINENLFPDEYNIGELKFFITDFQKEFKYEESLKAV